MADETNLQFWRGLSGLREKLQVDEDLRRQFEQDPVGVLHGQGLDLRVVTDTERGVPDTLAALLEGMSDIERKAVFDSLIAVSAVSQLDRVAVANANANANSDVNANVAANINAHANANTNSNSNGMETRDIISIDVLSVVLPGDFAQSELANRLDALQLNAARQSALLKRVVTDPDSLVESQRVDEGELRIAQYAYRGTVFQVEGLVRGRELVVLRADVLR